MSYCNRESLNAQAVEEAMNQHEGLVHAFIQRQGGGEISYEEALQAGRIGLWRAIKGYDPTRGTAFSTYAWVAICNQIRQRVRELKRERRICWGEVPHRGACQILRRGWSKSSFGRPCETWWASYRSVCGR